MQLRTGRKHWNSLKMKSSNHQYLRVSNTPKKTQTSTEAQQVPSSSWVLCGWRIHLQHCHMPRNCSWRWVYLQSVPTRKRWTSGVDILEPLENASIPDENGRNFTPHARFTAHEESELYLWHTTVANDLQTCDIDNEISQTWRKFGRNKSNLGEQHPTTKELPISSEVVVGVLQDPKNDPETGFHRVQHLAADSVRPHLPGSFSCQLGSMAAKRNPPIQPAFGMFWMFLIW